VNLYNYSKLMVLFSVIPGLFISFFPGKIAIVSSVCLLPFYLYLPKVLMKVKLIERNSISEYSKLIIFIFFFSNLAFDLYGLKNFQNTYDLIDIIINQLFITLLLPICIYFGINNQLFSKLITNYIKRGIRNSLYFQIQKHLQKYKLFY
jgi:hypothetical protein